MNIYISTDVLKDKPGKGIVRKFSIHHDIEMDCGDSAFFCANHVIELARDISNLLPTEEREDFYNFIKENLHHGN